MTEERLHIDWGNDKLYRTQRQVEKNPYDLEAWSILLREAQLKHISEVRPLYEHLITIFPSASRYWRIYIEHEMKSRNFEKVEKVMNVKNIDEVFLYGPSVCVNKKRVPPDDDTLYFHNTLLLRMHLSKK